MPIYEFFCERCNTIFNFFSKTINTSKQPPCPRCARKLKRQVSLFACIDRSRAEKAGDDLPFDIDESRLEKAMSSLAGEAEGINENDPRAAATLMKKFTEMTGVKLGDSMQEALRRMESGEDPEQIEADMGDLLESEDPFLAQGAKKGAAKQQRQPLRDETLYEL